MATPLGASVPLWFKPLGTSPAVNLLRDLPDISASRALSLGRADLGSVLYTVSSLPDDSTLEITIAHAERGIVARNVLLLVEIVHPVSTNPDFLWRIYHNTFVYRGDLQSLSTVLHNLFASTESRESWGRSPQRKFLSITNSSTLSELHEVYEAWLKFVNTELEKDYQSHNPNLERLNFLKKLNQERRTISSQQVTCAGVDPAGAHFFDATEAFTKAYSQFCKTGAVETEQIGYIDAVDNIPVKNPLMLRSCSMDNQYLHLLTDPLQSFHLAEAFDWHANPDPSYLAQIAMFQFTKWATAFRNAAQSDKRRVHVLYHHGDELALCYKMHCADGLPLYSGPQRIYELRLNTKIGQRRIGSCFDVIDTSELPKLRGLLAVIIATRPLLDPSPRAVLYTETTLKCYSDPLSDLKSMLCEDLETLLLLLGIAPIGLLLAHSTAPQSHNAWMNQSSSGETMVLPWKFIVGGDASADRSPAQLMPVIAASIEELAKLLSALLLRSSSMDPQQPFYTTPPTIAMLMRFLESRMTGVNWASVIYRTLQMAQASGAHIILREFQAWLLLAGFSDTSSRNPQSGVCFLTLSIPVSQLPKFCMASSKMRSTLLHLTVCILSKNEPLATFSNLLTGWVKTSSQDSGDNTMLVVSFAVPKAIFDSNDDQTEVVFFRNKTSSALERSGSRKEQGWVILKTHLHRLEQSTQPYRFEESSTRATARLSIPTDKANVWELMPKAPGSLARRTQRKVLLPRNLINFSYLSYLPCLVKVFSNIEGNGTDIQDLTTPFPAAEDLSITAPVFFDEENGQLASRIFVRFTADLMALVTPFPLVNTGESRLAWGMPSIALDELPCVPGTGDHTWLMRALDLSLSAEEEHQFEALENLLPVAETDNQLFQWKGRFRKIVKWSLGHIQARSSANPQQFHMPCHAFAFATSSIGPLALVLPIALRHDPAGASVVLDALVVVDFSEPWTGSNLIDQCIINQGTVQWLQWPEAMLLHSLLRASAERARRGTYQHVPDCPLNAEAPSCVLCACGVGRFPPSLVTDERLAPLLPRATRVALSLLFPVPYVTAVKPLQSARPQW